jgi:uncharacterized protein YunC (DUF1805 family)
MGPTAMRVLVLLLLAGCSSIKVDTINECSMDATAVAGFRIFLDINCSDIEERSTQEPSKQKKLLDKI